MGIDLHLVGIFFSTVELIVCSTGAFSKNPIEKKEREIRFRVKLISSINSIKNGPT